MLEKYMKNLNFQKKKIIMKDEDKKNFENSKTCYACGNTFNEKNDKVKDHCHYTGKFRGASCKTCNFKMKKPRFIPIITHNLANYDSHLFIKNLGKTPGEIKCIAKTEENYISFSKEIIVNRFLNEKQEIVNVKRELRFIDSFKFMSDSLERLSNNLEKDHFNNLNSFFEDGEKRELLRRKGVFPYDWFDNIEKLNEKNLPPKEEFYSKLNDEDVSDEDYEHAKKVWKKFDVKNMKDYLELYLKTDVLLLSDVFENFRKLFKKDYGLDPAWYYTTPGMAWDGMFKMTKIELDLISDPNMYLMIEKGIRGGICVVTKRYSKANNPYMG